MPARILFMYIYTYTEIRKEKESSREKRGCGNTRLSSAGCCALWSRVSLAALCISLEMLQPASHSEDAFSLRRTACQGLQSRGQEPRVGGDQYLGSVRAHPWAGAHIFSLGQTISVWYVGTQLIREKAACLRSLRAKGSNTLILDFFLSRCPPQPPKKSIPRRSLRPKNRPLTGPF